MEGVRETVRRALDAVFPPLCFSCERFLGGEEKTLSLCGGCLERFEIANGFFCPYCRRRLPLPQATCHDGAKFVLAAPLRFEDAPVRKLVHLLKYRHAKKAATPLAFFAVCYLLSIADAGFADAVMVPVPLHRSKERKRGFNQALLLAREIKRIAELLDRERRLPSFTIEPNAIARIRKTGSQTKRENYDDRKKNVEHAFAVSDRSKIAGRDVIVVDDVFTSGATMREMVKLLEANGARKIIALAAAQT